MAELNLSS
jgi:Na+/H+-translocating membrane pyrophosphatase